jgi:hypothetical protein
MRFERGNNIMDTIDIGSITEAFRGNFIRAVVKVDPVYIMNGKYIASVSSTLSAGVVALDDAHWFIPQIQKGNLIPLREYLISLAEIAVKKDMREGRFTFKGQIPHYFFHENQIWICKNDDGMEEEPVESFRNKSLVYRGTYYRI